MYLVVRLTELLPATSVAMTNVISSKSENGPVRLDVTDGDLREMSSRVLFPGHNDTSPGGTESDDL